MADNNSNIIRSWNGKTIRHRADGYFSLTDMAQACGKKYFDWYRLESTKSYLETLSTLTAIPVKELLQVNQGGVPELQGSWGHRKVAIRFAQWCSDDFAIQVDTWIEELLIAGRVKIDINTLTRNLNRGLEKSGYIYMFATVFDEESIIKKGANMIKIGYSLNPINRFKSISQLVPTPMAIIQVFENCRRYEELDFHKNYSDRCVKSEWYPWWVSQDFTDYFRNKVSVIDDIKYEPYRHFDLSENDGESICDRFGVYMC